MANFLTNGVFENFVPNCPNKLRCPLVRTITWSLAERDAENAGLLTVVTLSE